MYAMRRVLLLLNVCSLFMAASANFTTDTSAGLDSTSVWIAGGNLLAGPYVATSVTASSIYSVDYSADKGFDGNLATDWAVGSLMYSNGQWNGQWIQINFAEPYLFTYIEIQSRTTASYCNKVDALYVTFSDGTTVSRGSAWPDCSFPDDRSEYRSIFSSAPINPWFAGKVTSSIRLSLIHI